jgi:lipoprotein-anchoring transpeptidase ErfK/SrfK
VPRLPLLLCSVIVLGVAAAPSAASKARPSSGEAAALSRSVPPLVPQDVLALQVRLDRADCSPGEIDGVLGANTSRALAAYQRRHGLPITGEPDEATLEALAGGDPVDVLVTYAIAPDDVAGPFTPEIPDQLPEQATLPRLEFRGPLERIGEKFHVSPDLLRALNPQATFATAGEPILVPNVAASWQPSDPAGIGGPAPPTEGVAVKVTKSTGSLVVVTADGREVLHAPVSTGSEHDPLPIGEWRVTEVRPSPIYNYNPELFWDADPSHAKVQVQPGPNNPVGVVWIGLTRKHYGLHGTPEPGRVGHAQSHGCVRLTNWDAARVAALVTKGTPVVFEE